jgi:hypothetical protein
MPVRPIGLILAAACVAVTLPTARVHSQLPTPSSDPMADLQAIENANEDFIKRQDTTLQDLTDITETANQLRIFTKRG